MNIPVQHIGKYFELDAEGYLINPASSSHISDQLLPLVNHLVDSCSHYYGDDLHSLYLRGSLVRGTYIDEVSDLDAVCLLHSKGVRWQPASVAQELVTTWQSRYGQSIELDMMESSYSSSLAKEYPQLAVVLKTQALCVYGKDVLPDLPGVKLGPDLIIHTKWLKQDLGDYNKKVTKTAKDRQRVMKILIRCGFELCIEQEQKFTLDLFPAVQSFNNCFPERAADMELALYYFLNPDENVEKQEELIRRFGAWLLIYINYTLM